jgi:hypothetical protein
MPRDSGLKVDGLTSISVHVYCLLQCEIGATRTNLVIVNLVPYSPCDAL